MDFTNPFDNVEENIEITGWEPVLGGQLAEKAVSYENAQLAAEQLLISLKIDNESGVRSNCIWSLCRLYEKLNNAFQESFVDECTKIALFDKEPSVMEEAKTALDSMGMQGFYN